MRSLAVGIAVGVVCCASVAWSDPCSFTPAPDPAPFPPGRVVYQDAIGGGLYIYDFKDGTLTTVPISGLGSATNPVFSPDGGAILFSAVISDERHLFYWTIGSAQPVNITAWMGNLRNEDPKFSPDGYHVVWKQNFGIETANFAFNDLGQPILFNLQQLVANPPEASGPVYSPTQKYVYYFTSTSSQPEQIQRYDVAAATTAPAFAMDPTVQYYYPVAPDLYDFLYVSWLPGAIACPHCDKIYVRAKLPDSGTPWNPTDCAADNSDPAPVNEDYFVYSRRSATLYNLYLGQISTGNAWILPPAANISGASLVGSNYTDARSTINPAN